jgi:hypothetical protein
LLQATDKHHWAPVEQVVQWLTDGIPKTAKVLEIGPGHIPFPRADVFVDFQPCPQVKPDQLVMANLAVDPLPFEDKSFDFIYCRHVLEDMYNPILLCNEMSRVGKAGYIEAPSPIAECCRGVDGNAPPYRGYHHHRFIIWTYKNELRLVSKYPILEYLSLDENWMADQLRPSPKYWNTYHLWKDTIDVRHRQNALDFHMLRDYGPMLVDATKSTIDSVNEFWKQVPETNLMPQPLPRLYAAS